MAQRFMELVRGAASRAVMQRSASSSAQPAAPQDELICQPQSHAMQRSIELLPYPETDNTPSPSSDEGFSSTSTAGMEATPSPSYHSLSPHCGTQGLHSPLDINDDRLLGVAEMLAKSITEHDLEGKHFTESYGIDDDPRFDNYPYQSGEEVTVLAMWCVIKRAALPVDTFVLASLILEELGEPFYHEWLLKMNVINRGPYGDRTREVVIVSACIIAQKFLHDAIYTLSTWTGICCKPRHDINHRNLEMTERLILKHIAWSVSRIANEQIIAERHEQIMDANVEEFQRKYCELYTQDLDDYDGADSPYYSSYSS